jgi:regulator of cell morphogenesis and NO signaling
MKLLTPSMKMADVVHSNYLLMPVIGRFGIPLGFGEETVAEVCRKYRIDIDFFMAIINAFSNENYFPEKKLQSVDVLTILDYLEKTHAYYIGTQVPLIERLLKQLRGSGLTDARNLRLVGKFFGEYREELFAHLHREENMTFPYIRNVVRWYTGTPLPRRTAASLSRYSMQMYEEEHSDIDEKLYDLKNILIKYVRGDESHDLCNQVIFELFRLEKDIKDHTRIENHVLRPLVMEMETALLRRAGRTVPAHLKDSSAQSHGTAASRGRVEGAVSPIGIQTAGEGGQQEELSAREREILRLVACGYLNKQIADACSISLHTVISHRKNITRKLQIRTVAGLTVYALMNGLISSREIS